MKRVSAGVLKNGFRFYTQLDDRTHVSGIGVKAGSVHDPPEHQGTAHRGMAHCVEHIIGSYSQADELTLERYQCGPEENINIFVDHTSSFFGHDMLLRREHMLELFRIFAGGLKHPQLQQETLDGEKAAVLNEYYLRGIDAMESLIHDLMHQVMYEKNPARNRIDCEPGELAQITMRDVRAFIKKYYVPNNMFAVILGPSFRKARTMAEEYFGDLTPRDVPPLTYDSSENHPIRRTGPKIVEVPRPGIHQYHVAVGFPIEPFGHKDDEAVQVLSHIWRWRLREALRRQNREFGKGTYRALTFVPQTFLHGMIYATFATPDVDFAKAGTEKILAECRALQTKWVGDDELTAMRDKLYHGYVEDFTILPDELALRIIHAAANGDEEMHRLNSYLGRLNRVGKKSILRVANEYFTADSPVSVVIKPE